MFLTIAFHYKSYKMLIPLTIVLGSVPSFVIAWTSMRLLTLILPHSVYRRADDFLYELYQRQIMFFFENLSNIKLYLYGDYEFIINNKESAIVISNHQSTADWLVCNMLAIRQGSLGRIRFTLKHGLKYFPMFGLYWRMHGFIYLQRQGDMNKLKKQLNNLDIPSWLYIFPEGTRFNPKHKEVIAMSRKYAAEHDLPQFTQVLFPHIRSTYLAISALESKIDAIYDITIAYRNTNQSNKEPRPIAPSITEILLNKSVEIHLQVNRIPIENIQQLKSQNNEFSEESIANWLINIFDKKDKTLKTFYSTDSNFLSKGQISRLKLRQTLPSLIFFSLSTAVLLNFSKGRKLYWQIYLYGSIFSILCMKVDTFINKV